MDTESIYTPTGQLRMPEAAELANIEATKGQDARIAREQELKRQVETGFTDEERKNIEIQDALGKKYPDAFNEIIDSQGRKVLVSGGQEGTSAFVFSQVGVLEIPTHSQPFESGDLNIEGLLEEVKNKKPNFGQVNIGGWEGVPTEHVFKKDSKAFKDRQNSVSGYSSLRILDLDSQNNRSHLHTSLIGAQSEGERRKLVAEGKAPSSSFQTIISEL